MTQLFPAPAETKNMAEDVKEAILTGDWQINAPPYQVGFFQTMTVNSESQGGHTLPAKNMGITHVVENLARNTVKQPHGNFRGLLTFGDMTELGSTEEWDSFVDLTKRLREVSPFYRLSQFMTGNHDILHAGTGKSGWDFFGAMGVLLDLVGPYDYQRDIYAPQVGGMEKRLTKDILLRRLYPQFFGRKADPVVLKLNEPQQYRIQGQEPSSWEDSERVVYDFWRQEKDGSLTALLQYQPDGLKRYPTQEWLYTSAIKLNEVRTPNGNFPTWFIGLDTLDLLSGGTGVSAQLAANYGHVSFVQIKIIRTLIESIKKREPKAKFILGGHYPVDQIAGVEKVSLGRLLSDPSIVAFVGAHAHRRGMDDLAKGELAEQLGIQRKSPLIQVLIPSVIDFPSEMVKFRFGIDSKRPDQLFYEFNFSGLETKDIAGMSPEVEQELASCRPFLNVYRSAIAKIDDPAIREFSTPGTPFLRKLDIALHLDAGLLNAPGAFNDEMIVKDGTPAMMEDVKLYHCLGLSVVKLSMKEAGQQKEAAEFEKIYWEELGKLNDYWERIRTGHYSGPFLIKVKELRDKGNSHYLAGSLVDFLEATQAWLIGYEIKRKQNLPSQKMRNAANLFGDSRFRIFLKEARKLPYGSQTSAFLARAFLESSEQSTLYYQGPNKFIKNVPDKIRIEVSTGDDSIQAITSKLTPPQEQVLPKPEAEEKEVFTGGIRGVQGHLFLRQGFFWGENRSGWSASLGGQWHLLDQYNRPRINVGILTGVELGGSLSLPSQASVNVGDSWGLFEVGPTFVTGALFHQGSSNLLLGFGGRASVLEGLINFDFGRRWYLGEAKAEWSFVLSTDILAALRFVNVLDRRF